MDTTADPQFFQLRKTLVPWLFLSTVLTLSLLSIDFLASGPVSSWFLAVTVIEPVQSRYGFAAEWQTVGPASQLVVTSVKPGGVFAEAGIAPGFAFPFVGCGNFYFDGAWYRTLALNPAELRLQTVPGDVASARTFRLKRADFRLTAERDARILASITKTAVPHEATYPDEATKAIVKGFLPSTATVDEWSRLAKLFWSMQSGLAEHYGYDSVFEFAQWHCLEQIAATPGPDAGVLLEHVLKPVMGDDGHASEEFSELIRRQRALPIK